MTAHVLDQVLDAIVAQLKAANTDAGQNVYRGRVLSLSEFDDELPALLVSMAEDLPLQHAQLSNVKYLDMRATVIVKAVVKEHTTTLDAALLKLRAQVHAAMMAAPQLGLSTVIFTWPSGQQAPDLTAEGDEETGALPLIWLVQYRTNLTDPTVLT